MFESETRLNTSGIPKLPVQIRRVIETEDDFCTDTSCSLFAHNWSFQRLKDRPFDSDKMVNYFLFLQRSLIQSFLYIQPFNKLL